MTRNQLVFQQNVESIRHNRATESQAARELGETRRSNLARETETNRSNVAKETETNRHNTTTERETERHNRYGEGVDTAKAVTGGIKDVTSGFQNVVKSIPIIGRLVG